MTGSTTRSARSSPLMPVAMIILAVASCGIARADPLVPTFDVAKTCRTQVDYAYAATLGQFDIPREMEACQTRERAQRGSVEALWPLASKTDRSECLDISEGRYSYLARCLAGSRSVRATR